MKRDRFFSRSGRRYLRADDIGDDVVTHTIRACDEVEFSTNPTPKPVLYFEEEQRALVLNVSNWDTLAALFGGDSDCWIGHRITLFVMEGEYQGKPWAGIRLRIPNEESENGAVPF